MRAIIDDAAKEMVMIIHSGTSVTVPTSVTLPTPVSVFVSVVKLQASTVVQLGTVLVESVCATNPILLPEYWWIVYHPYMKERPNSQCVSAASALIRILQLVSASDVAFSM